MKKLYFILVTVLICASTACGQSVNQNSLLFDQQDIAVVPDSPLLNSFTNQITIECWFKASSPIVYSHLICKGGAWLIHFLNNNVPTGYFWLGAQYYISGNPINDLLWHHIAMTYNGSQIKLYQDGFLVNTVNKIGTIQTVANPLTFGNVGNVGQYPAFMGNMDEIRIWNRALSNSEIIEKKSTILVPSLETGLIGYWRFEEGFGSLINDISGNALNGTQSNCTWSNAVPFTYSTNYQADNVIFPKIYSNGMKINWDDGQGEKRVVFIKQGNSGSSTPVNNITYTPNVTFGSGSQVGTSGWFCVYNGIVHSSGITISNLQPSTDYRIMVCEYYGSAGNEIYNTASNLNNPKTQRTYCLTSASNKLTSAPEPNCLSLVSANEFSPFSWSTGEHTKKISVCSTGNYFCNSGIATDTIGVFISKFNDSIYTPNGKIYSVVRKGDTVYMGGQFDYMARVTGTGAHFQWPRDYNTIYMPRVNGPIDRIVSDGSGGWYIMGNFTKVGVDSIKYLAHINTDKKLDTTFRPNPNGSVKAICINGNRMYVGGSFTKMGDVTRGYLLMLDKLTGAATSWDPQINGVVNGLAVYGDKVYVGGSFTSLGTQARSNLGAVDTNFAMASSWNPNPNNKITKLVLDGIKLYVVGDFTNISGSPRTRLASYTLLTGNLDTWSPDPNNSVYDLAVATNSIYVAGKFTSIGGSARNFIACLNNTNGNATNWSPAVNDTVHSVAVSNSYLYAGGRFTMVNTSGTPVERFKGCSFNLSDGQVTSWAPNLIGLTGQNAKVNAIATYGNNVYMGGDFFGAKCWWKYNIASINALNGNLTAFNPCPNGRVRSIYIDGNNIYMGGDFTTVWGGTANIPRNRIARVDINNTLSSWNPNADGAITSMVAKGQYLYVGGAFSTIGSNPRPRLCAVKISDGTSSTWAPNPNDTVKTLTIGGDSLYVGGDFTNISSTVRNRLASYNISSSVLTSFDPNLDGEVLALAYKNNTLFLGGSFSTIAGQARKGFALFKVNTNALQPLQMTLSSVSGNSVNAVSVADSAIYASGSFTFQNNALTNCTNSLAFKVGKSIQTKQWHPDPNGLVRTMSLYKDKLYLGGDFTESLNIYQPYFTAVENFCTVDNYLPAPADTNFCQGDSVPLWAAPGVGYKYQWYKDNLLLPGAIKRYYVPIASGYYKALITDSINSGSLFTNAHHVTVDPLASSSITASGPIIFCGASGQSVLLTASSGTGYAYQWYKNNVIIGGANSPGYTATTSGNYYCVIYNASGCPNESQHVVVNADGLSPMISLTGTNPFCQGTTVTLSSNFSTGYSHQWYRDNAKIVGSTSQTLITTTTGTYKVRDSIGSCAGFSNEIALTVSPLPGTAGNITGNTTICPSVTSTTYSVISIANATSYIWILPTGVTGSSSTNSITVTFGVGFTGGNIIVKGHNNCGDGTSSSLAIIPGQIPVSAGIISGPTTVFRGSNGNIYQVTPVNGATSYLWSLPPGASGNSTNNSISVSFGISSTSGNTTVKAQNICGDGPVSTLYITVQAPPPQFAPITTCASRGAANNAPVSVPVTVTNFDSITSLSLRLDYDPTLLTYTGNSNPNPALTGLIVNDNHVSATLHKVLMIWTDIAPKTLPANSKITDLNFTHISGTTLLNWNNESNGGADCEYADKNGDPLYDLPTSQFYINGDVHLQQGYKVSGNFNYNNSAATILDNVKVYLKLNTIKIDSVITDVSGYYEFPLVQNNTYTLDGATVKPWGGVNGTDALKIQRHFVGLELLTEPVRLQSADVNLSYSINGTDALKVKRRFAGLENSFTRGDWTFAKQITGGDTVIVAGADVTANFFGLCVGDVNGSNTPSPGKSLVSLIDLELNGTIEAALDKEFELPVKIMQDAQVGAISLVFTYPDEYLTLVDLTIGDKSLSKHVHGNQIRVAWSEIEPMNLNKEEILVWIRFRLHKPLDNGQLLSLSLGIESEIADGWANPIICTLSAPAITSSKLYGMDDPGASLQNCMVYPNPATEQLTIEFNLMAGSPIKISLIDLNGKQIDLLLSAELPKGDFKRTFRLNSLPPGVYTVRINSTGDKSWNYYKKLVISPK